MTERWKVVYELNRSDEDRPAEFELLERTWDLVPGVFSPTYTPVTRLFTSWLPYPEGGSFLEIGTGAGVTAVCAALAGCARVVATDISEAAVENASLNAVRHGVDDRVEVVLSDLFDALAGERFDAVYWNSSFTRVPADTELDDVLEASFVDPGYRAHERFLAEVSDHLAPRGRVLWSSIAISSSDTSMAARALKSFASSKACFSPAVKGQIIASECTSRSSFTAVIDSQSAGRLCLAQ